MSDLLLNLGQNPNTRKLVQSLGLPIPLPQKLRRALGPWQERPLQDRDVVVGLSEGAHLGATLAGILGAAGANPLVIGDEDDVALFRAAGEAYGRPPRHLANGAVEALKKADGFVYDASGMATPADLVHLHDFFNPLMRKLDRCGRVVVLGRPPRHTDGVSQAATQRALEGFVRSLAKEVGKRGATVQLVQVAPGAEDRLAGVLRFIMSDRAAFVSGQPVLVDTLARPASQTPFVRPLDGKTVLVTGAARGIGKATAKLLAAEGAHVVCLDRPADDGPCSQVAREVGGSVILADVSDPDAPKHIADQLAELRGGVDVVIHNAGVTRDKTLARMQRDRWEQTLDINLRAVVDITLELRDRGLLRDEGRVICLSSVAGIAGNMGQTNYAASKAGVIGFVEKLAPELADRGITVNAIAPGFIETRLTAAIPPVIREVGRRLSALGQGGLPQDVGEALTFLASPGSHGISGQVLRVCGGAFIGA